MSTGKEYKWDKQMIKDLFDPTDMIRRVGRTQLLAKIFVELAKENPHIEITLIDHFPVEGSLAKDNLLREVKLLLDKENKRLEESNYNRRFVVTKNRNIVYTSEQRMPYIKSFKDDNRN